MNIVICDDDRNYGELLSEKIKLCLSDMFNFSYEIIYKSSLDELSEFLENDKADILFLDIMVNGVNSVDWSLSNLNGNNFQLIFMTFYPVEAYNIFETKCSYFLIKSKITDEQLKNALKKCIGNITQKKADLLIVKIGAKSVTLNLQDIEYIESLNNNISIYFNEQPPLTLYMKLKDFEKLLPLYFMKCHKSFIINMNAVTGCEPYEFTLHRSVKIPIPSRKYKDTVKTYNDYINNL